MKNTRLHYVTAEGQRSRKRVSVQALGLLLAAGGSVRAILRALERALAEVVVTSLD
ncbi:hypothetical protein K431DRAFT_308338 [Polychaeton citri CBS 116435]|uniref:Uncharacterized protein n=1 Tax=Polychaeton citri CBS 116435 TaxID=1314669 RepID=A0A9P4PXV8_9PEZI|nr:hypothetical protein K431DRAFT_308338 [Polychaeton citri CBS 116435]